MRVYLDNCCFNRPFDNQNQIRINLESQAKLYVQSQIKDSQIELVWSYMLDYENAFNPFEERKTIIQKWQSKAILDIDETEQVLQNARELVSFGLKSKDALHVACAIEGKCDYFLLRTTKF